MGDLQELMALELTPTGFLHLHLGTKIKRLHHQQCYKVTTYSRAQGKLVASSAAKTASFTCKKHRAKLTKERKKSLIFSLDFTSSDHGQK